MKCLGNNKGFALITSLLITMLSLVIVLGILYVVTQGIKTGASQKVYRNAVEASYGGADLTMYEIVPELANAILATASPDVTATNLITASLESTFGGINLDFVSTAACFNQKLQFDSSAWTSCTGTPASIKTKDITENPDMTLNLTGPSGSAFTVYSKIVDTIPGTPYMPPPPGGPLLGGGVTETGGASVSVGRHYIYRIEVIGQKATNPSEQGNLTVMYEY